MKQTLVTGAAAAPFAHLLGFGRKVSGRRAEDDKPDDKEGARAEGEDDEDKDEKKDGKRGEDDKPDDKEGARAEGEDDEEKDDKKDGKRGRKAKGEDDDETCAEEQDDDEDVASAARAGRLAERARCRKIFSSEAAGLRPDVAAQLAFTTNLPSAQALGILEAAATGAAPQASRRIDERMASVHVPNVGGDAPTPAADTPKGKANAIVAAMNKARGGK